MMNDYLNENLVELDILPRLPVKSLFRLQCVSKKWQELISRNSHFVYLQSRLGPSGGFVRLEDNSWEQKHNSIHIISRDPKLVYIPPPFLPWIQDGSWGDIVASCNGLLCVCYTSEEDDNLRVSIGNYTSEEDDNLRVSIGNPVFNDWIFFDLHHLLSYDHPAFGLAVDIGESDVSYNLVSVSRVYEGKGNDTLCIFFVFSSRTQQWKMSKETVMLPSPLRYKSEAAYVKGSLYWIAEPPPRKSLPSGWIKIPQPIQPEPCFPSSLLWFDPKGDRSGLHPLPVAVDCKSGCMQIGECSGKLCYALVTISGIQIWYMDDRSCWTKTHSASPSPDNVLRAIELNEEMTEEQKNKWWKTNFTRAQLMPLQDRGVISFCVAEETICSYNIVTDEVAKLADTTSPYGWFPYRNSLVPLPKL